MMWDIQKVSKTKITNPILIEGLPGMGNVGKIAVDFLIDSLNAEKIFEITSHSMPHCVFVNEDNLVELPEIEIYHKKIKDKSFLFLSGDIQPINEQSCYEFCHAILDNFQKDKGKEIVTLGGIGLASVPEDPKVYCTGNDKKFIKKFIKSKTINENIHGVVGPIVGVSGLLTGLAGKRKIPAISLLAETFSHPNYLGIKGAKEILRAIDEEYKLKLNLSELDEEIEMVDQAVKKVKTNKKQERKGLNISKVKKVMNTRKINTIETDTDYIG
ncbi:MAG: PAC2 family protein [Candidatus Nanoarchaeia archaeon]|nr:PAC2 family protein [Candidatus Nanoarchaeia archaeon]